MPLSSQWSEVEAGGTAVQGQPEIHNESLPQTIAATAKWLLFKNSSYMPQIPSYHTEHFLTFIYLVYTCMGGYVREF